jgi:predicted MFS family arabinose efflux permease
MKSSELGGAAQMPAFAIRVMAVTAGTTIANVFYNQPMLELIGHDLRVGSGGLGLIPAATLAGYAGGLLFLVPLGDRLDRKRLVLVQLVGALAALFAAAGAFNLVELLAAACVIGLCSTVTQQLVPFAASLAPVDERRRVVGTVVSAIMIGILLARAIGGLASQFLGWRAVFAGAALIMRGSFTLATVLLPPSRPTTSLSYPRLLGSLAPLVRRHPTLREAMLGQALLFGVFNALWATLASYLSAGPYHLGSAWTGAFGLVGAAGAIAAAMAGRLSDRIGARRVVIGCGAVVAASCAILAQGSLVALVMGVLVLDLGVQGALVANQSRVFAGSRRR